MTVQPHLTDDEVLTLALARVEAGPPVMHLAGCPACRERVAGWRHLRAAGVIAASELTGPVRAPSFDALLAPALGALPAAPLPALEPATATAPASAPEPPQLDVATSGLAASWSSLTQLAAAQLQLVPRLLLPLTLVALAATVALALAVPAPEDARNLFGAGVSVILLTGALSVCSRRTDPRNELLTTLPVSPVTVFATRLTMVLSSGCLLGLAASVTVVVTGGAATLPQLVAGWFGQALLASACGVLGTVWRSPAAGAAAALLVWGIGSLGSLSRGVVSDHLGSVIDVAWATTPAPIAAALVLLALSAWMMREMPVNRVSA